MNLDKEELLGVMQLRQHREIWKAFGDESPKSRRPKKRGEIKSVGNG